MRLGISVTSRMLPKDLRTLRRPLNVVAIPAPIFLSNVSEANFQRPDYQPSVLGKSAFRVSVISAATCALPRSGPTPVHQRSGREMGAAPRHRPLNRLTT